MSGVVSPDLGCSGVMVSSKNSTPCVGNNSNKKKKRSITEQTTAESERFGPSSYRMDPIVTEQLALIGFAARLGTSITRDAAEATLTRSDAQLLMSLLRPSSPSSQPSPPSQPLLSDTDGVSSSEEDTQDLAIETVAPSIRPTSSSIFTFTCPALSIDANQQRAIRTMTTDRLALALSDVTPASPSSSPATPSYLLGRTIVTRQRDGVSDAVEVMARNIMQAFSVALEWRCSVWVSSLTKLLALKKSLMAQHVAKLRAERKGRSKKGHAGEKNDEKDQNVSIEEQELGEEEDEDSYDYAETAAIDHLARVISEMSVMDVKTSFRVLHQDDEELIQPKKRIKARQVTLEGKDQHHALYGSATSLYERSSPLAFEATLTVLFGSDEEHIVLKSPGTIVGTFAGNSTDEEGEEVLVGVDLKLDTDVLAQSMEEQSRLLLRAAAEAAMGPSPQILDLTQPEEPKYSKHSPSSVPKPVVSAAAHPNAAVITPRQGNSPSSPFSSAGAAGQIIEDLTIPLPSVPYLDSETPTSSPKMMTPTQITRSVSETSASSFLFSPKQTVGSSNLPKLVSPSPVQKAHADSDTEVGPRAEESEWYSYRGSDDENDVKPEGPKLPALVEVACAAIASNSS